MSRGNKNEKIFVPPITIKEKDPRTIFIVNETDVKLYFILEENTETNIATLYVATDLEKIKEKMPQLAGNPSDTIESNEIELIAAKYAGLTFVDLAPFNLRVEAHEFEGHPYQTYVLEKAEMEEAPTSSIN